MLITKTKTKKQSWHVTFIPGIWTHSIAVPVAFERNSVKVSSAIERSLEGEINLVSGKDGLEKARSAARILSSDFLTQKGYLHPL